MQENKNEKVNENERAPGMKPRLALYHANAKGTGCAIKMELHPAVGASGRTAASPLERDEGRMRWK